MAADTHPHMPVISVLSVLPTHTSPPLTPLLPPWFLEHPTLQLLLCAQTGLFPSCSALHTPIAYAAGPPSSLARLHDHTFPTSPHSTQHAGPQLRVYPVSPIFWLPLAGPACSCPHVIPSGVSWPTAHCGPPVLAILHLPSVPQLAIVYLLCSDLRRAL